MRDVIGGRSATYERELHKAKSIAMDEIVAEAEKLGANAIVGIDLDYETMGANCGMLMVSVSGTAVVIE